MKYYTRLKFKDSRKLEGGEIAIIFQESDFYVLY